MQNFICYTLGRAGSTYSLRALSNTKKLWNFEEIFKASHNAGTTLSNNKYLFSDLMQDRINNCEQNWVFKITPKQYPYIDHKWFYTLLDKQETVSMSLYRDDLLDWILSYIFAFETNQWHSDEHKEKQIPTYSKQYLPLLKKLKEQVIHFTYIRRHFDHVIEYEDIPVYFDYHFGVDVTTYTEHTKLYSKEEKLINLNNLDEFLKDFNEVFESKQFINK